MKRLIDFLMGGPKPEPEKDWKLIGQFSGRLESSSPFSKSKEPTKIPYTISLWMTEDGGKKVGVKCGLPQGTEWLKHHSQHLHDAEFWAEGGHFPQDFDYIGDTLSPMLVRLVDQEMGLDQ